MNKMIGNIIYRYSEWLNRREERKCENLQKSISKRKWLVNHVPKLYAFEHIAFAGIVVSFIFAVLAIWNFSGSDWFAFLIAFYGLVYFITVLLLDRIYKNR